jgi:hypothetical protein
LQIFESISLLWIAIEITYVFQNPNMIRRASPAESYLGFICNSMHLSHKKLGASAP